MDIATLATQTKKTKILLTILSSSDKKTNNNKNNIMQAYEHKINKYMDTVRENIKKQQQQLENTC